jgi:DNA-binding transcriptional LysR family regulator
MNITLRHLQQIETIARQGNFARSARELNISQPALSRSIAHLENQLGLKLFDRSKREVVPTVFGEHILERGKPVLQDMYMMERDLAQLQGLESGELVIGSGPFPAEISLGKAMARFSKNHPKVNVRIVIDHTPNLLTRLRKRELDIFIADIRMITDTSELNIIQLPKHQGYFCCRTGHPISVKKQIVFQDVFSYPLAAMWLPETLLRSMAREAGLQLHDVADLPCAVMQCDYLKVVFETVAGSDAIGLITRSILENSFLRDQLVLLPITLSELYTRYGLVTLSRYSRAPVVQMFQQHMIETEEQLACGKD